MQFQRLDSGLMVPEKKRASSRPDGLPQDFFARFPTSWHVVHYADFWASARYRMINSHAAEFDVREWFFTTADGTVYYGDRNGRPTEDMGQGWPIMASGSVNSDGNANLAFHTEDLMLHVDSFDRLRRYTAILETIYCDVVILLNLAGAWNNDVLPQRKMPFSAEEEAWRHLHEAMAYVCGEKDATGRGPMVWNAVYKAKEAMTAAGVEMETLC